MGSDPHGRPSIDEECVEILRFFDVGVKIKMIRLKSNSVAVDEKKDVIKAEKLLKLKKILRILKFCIFC